MLERWTTSRSTYYSKIVFILGKESMYTEKLKNSFPTIASSLSIQFPLHYCQ